MKKNPREVAQQFAEQCASDAYYRMCQNTSDDLYIYYKPGEPGHQGGVVVDTKPLNSKWLLAHPRRVPKLSVRQLTPWFYDIIRTLPILDPTEE